MLIGEEDASNLFHWLNNASKVEGEDAQLNSTDPNAALGLLSVACRNILQYDVLASSRNELFRVFESRDHHATQNVENYKIFWLAEGRFKHILNRHGSETNFTLDADHFFEDSLIIPTIHSSIVNSQSENRGINPGSDNNNSTTFQTRFPTKIDREGLTDVIQIWTNEGARDTTAQQRYRIETAFPLNPTSEGIKGDLLP